MKISIVDSAVIKATTAFKILADPTRFKILCLLLKAKEGLCVYEVAEGMDISHSAASHQLTKLEARGIVKSYREGQTVCYEMCENTVTRNIQTLMKPFIQ